MGVRLSDDEAWDYLAAGHTGILTTLRRDGWPVSLPLWYVVDGRAIYVSTPVKSKKVTRIRHDDRGSFLVESGDAWVDLAAVQLARDRLRFRAIDETTLGAAYQHGPTLDGPRPRVLGRPADLEERGEHRQ